MADDTEIDVTTFSAMDAMDSFPLDLDIKSSENRVTKSSSDQSPRLRLKRELKSSQNGEDDKHSNDNDSKPSLDDGQSKEEDKEEKASHSRASPEPACSICLGSLQNKCFTDSCSHTFCFACLLEWSKIKPECPLCKVHFKSIVHNVRSVKDFDQYYVEQAPFSAINSARTLYRRSLNHLMESQTASLNAALSQQFRLNPIFSLGIEQHRITYAPHSIRTPAMFVQEEISQTPRNLEFRQRIYAQNLWAKEPSLRHRFASPEFYRSNPACTHRLVPWLTRELTVLLDGEHRVSFVLDFIMSIILRYDIRSKEFFLHSQSYIGSRTCHFVHEFYTFAASMYDMDEYDEHIQYDTHTPAVMSSPEPELVDVTSSNSDEEYSFEIISPSLPNYSRNSFSPLPSSSFDRCKKQKRIPKISLKKNHESNSWNVSQPPISPTSSTSSTSHLSIVSNSKSDKSPEHPFLTLLAAAESEKKKSPISITLSSDDDNDEIFVDNDDTYNDDDEGEVAILAEMKPKWMRTPEIVDLSSDSEKVEKTENAASLPDLEPVSDGSFTVEYSDSEISSAENKSSNPLEVTKCTNEFEPVPAKSKNKRKHSKHSSSDRHKHRDKHSKQSRSNQQKRRPNLLLNELRNIWEPHRRWSSSSSSPSPSREAPSRPWSPIPDYTAYASSSSKEKKRFSPNHSQEAHNNPESSHVQIREETLSSSEKNKVHLFSTDFVTSPRCTSSDAQVLELHMHHGHSSSDHKKHKERKGKRKQEKHKHHKH